VNPTLQSLFDQLNRVGLPYRPRAYQLPFWEAMVTGGKKRADVVWHRRAGKDTTALSFLLWEAARQAGIYWYLAPTYNQGKKIIWDGQTSRGMGDDRNDGRNDGVPFKSFVPPSWLDTSKGSGSGFVEDEMQIWLKNGSLIQVVGTDKLDSVRGANVRGAVFSEYSVSKPESWTHLIEPMLMENGGWAVFVYTPQGQNHAYRLHTHAQGDPDWYSSLLTVADTKRPDGTPVIDPREIERRVADGRLDRETADQEYYCSFLGSIVGAYYAPQMRWLAQTPGRIGRVSWDPALPVSTWWDLGYDDATTLWFVQRSAAEVRLIDYEEHSGEGLPFYAKLLTDKPYVYLHHQMPHDIEVHELGSGVKRRETATKLGIKPIRVTARHNVHEGIDAVRGMLQRCWFDAEKCERGLQALREYRKEYDAEKFVYKKTPRHDQWSHGADAFRTGAKGDSRPVVTEHRQEYVADYDPRTLAAEQAANDFDPRGL
jgi:phage terminase large subunit